MIRTIIPSKDRAAQLDLLLRSLKRFRVGWEDDTIIVLYRVTSDEFREGFKILMKEHPQFVYVEEDSFTPDVKKLALSGEEGYLQFLVDDDIYIRPFSTNSEEFRNFSTDESVVALSLRMDPSKNLCYTENVATPPPWFRADRAWFWPGLRGDWGYPHSVDGSVWRRRDVRKVIGDGQYAMLHQLEPALRYAMTRPLAICYEKARLVNIANNTVQDMVASNRHAGGDHVEMNRRYLDGERLDLEPILSVDPPSPHFEMDYSWT